MGLYEQPDAFEQVLCYIYHDNCVILVIQYDDVNIDESHGYNIM